MERALCSVDGCNNLSKIDKVNKKGITKYKKFCNAHHKKKYRMNEYKYRWCKKTFCENIDGRLGFVCQAEIHHPTMLSVDHIDGNNTNNLEINLQTLCLNCHAYKTIKNGDHLPPSYKRIL